MKPEIIKAAVEVTNQQIVRRVSSLVDDAKQHINRELEKLRVRHDG